MSEVLLVTGASTGLGVAVAIQAAKAGYTVYATMRDISKQSQLRQAADEADVSVHVAELDVVDSQQVSGVIEDIVSQHGHIDCIVANAGIGYVRPTEQADEDAFLEVLNTNLLGVFRCVKAAMPHMRSQGSGRFVAISSVGGLIGQPFNEIYCASKFALEGYFESLASYVGPCFGIHFSLVEPGGIKSEFANSILKEVTATGGFPDDAYKPLIERYIGGRATRNTDGVFQSADEVAEIVLDCLAADAPPVRVRTSPWSEAFSSLKTQADPNGKRAQQMVYESMLGSE